MNTEEIWKVCANTPERIYELSNYGQARSIKKQNCKNAGEIKILKPTLSGKYPNQYYQISTGRGGKKKIHVLMALIFLGRRPEGFHIDHIDRNRFNNNINNLRYCTQSENMINRDFYKSHILETDKEKRAIIIRKEWREKRGATKIECECGSITNKNSIFEHRKSVKHKTWLESP